MSSHDLIAAEFLASVRLSGEREDRSHFRLIFTKSSETDKMYCIFHRASLCDFRSYSLIYP